MMLFLVGASKESISVLLPPNGSSTLINLETVQVSITKSV